MAHRFLVAVTVTDEDGARTERKEVSAETAHDAEIAAKSDARLARARVRDPSASRKPATVGAVVQRCLTCDAAGVKHHDEAPKVSAPPERPQRELFARPWRAH